MPKRSIRSPSQFTAPGALRKTPPRLAHSGEGGDHALPQRQLAHGQGLVDGEDVGPAGKQADLRALGVGGGQRPRRSGRVRMRAWGGRLACEVTATGGVANGPPPSLKLEAFHWVAAVHCCVAA